MWDVECILWMLLSYLVWDSQWQSCTVPWTGYKVSECMKSSSDHRSFTDFEEQVNTRVIATCVHTRLKQISCSCKTQCNCVQTLLKTFRHLLTLFCPLSLCMNASWNLKFPFMYLRVIISLSNSLATANSYRGQYVINEEHRLHLQCTRP